MSESHPSYAEICALPAGRQLDALMAAELRREHRREHRRPPNASRWSQKSLLALSLIAELSSPFWMKTPWVVTLRVRNAGCADVEAWTCRMEGSVPDDWYAEASGATLALAVCRAFLQFRED
jgi:hypothetical protein